MGLVQNIMAFSTFSTNCKERHSCHPPTMKTTRKPRVRSSQTQPSSRPRLATCLTQFPRSAPRACLVPPTTRSPCSSLFTPKKKSGPARDPSIVSWMHQSWCSRLAEERVSRRPSSSSPLLDDSQFSAPNLSSPPPPPAPTNRSSVALLTGSFNENPTLSSCVLCRALTTVQVSKYPSWTRGISAFAEEDDDVLRGLASMGVVFDHQVETILGLDSSIIEQLAGQGSLKASMKYRLLFLVEREKERRRESTHMSFRVDGTRTTDIVQVPCALNHLPVDLTGMTRELRSLLQTEGILELCPAVALIGLLTLADFKLFCSLSQSAQKRMIMNAGIRLTPFQNFMLNRTLQANAIG